MEALILVTVTAAAGMVLAARRRQRALQRDAHLMACKRATMRRDLVAFVRRERAAGF